MTTFLALYEKQREQRAGDPQALEREFAALVAQGPLHWLLTDSSPEAPRRLLLGVATYSLRDMRLLDLVRETINKQAATAKHLPRVEVFSTLACKTHQDFDGFIPGIGIILHTPVVGWWLDGHLCERATGAAGRVIIARVLGADLAALEQTAK